MLQPLSEYQIRVLGVLLEKALAQAQYYPLTVNAVVTGCNQKSNRDPVMDLDEPTVWDVLEQLRDRQLVTRIAPGASSRVDRFKHEAKAVFGWERPQQAVMAELFLRGPQTVGELRGRCARMVAFENTDAIAAVLDTLAAGDDPHVEQLPREAGRSAPRWRHRHDGAAALTPKPAPPPPASVGAPPPTESQPQSPPVAAADDSGHWREELASLQSEIGDLHEELADVRRRLSRLEDHLQ